MSKINIEALTAARDLFLGLGEVAVNQAHWSNHYEAKWSESTGKDITPECGSPACMGGQIAQSEHYRFAGGDFDPNSGAPTWPATDDQRSPDHYGATALAMYFNLPMSYGFCPIAEALTDGLVSPYAYPAASHADRQPTALEVAAALTSIIDTGDLPCPAPS